MEMKALKDPVDMRRQDAALRNRTTEVVAVVKESAESPKVLDLQTVVGSSGPLGVVS